MEAQTRTMQCPSQDLGAGGGQAVALISRLVVSVAEVQKVIESCVEFGLDFRFWNLNLVIIWLQDVQIVMITSSITEY